jgi:3-oxoisoapionate decarboxylase
MRLRLGYDTYSLRALKWNAFQHLEYAAQQKLDAIQFSSLDVFETFEPDYLGSIKIRAKELGIKVDAGIGCVCELSKSWNAKSGTPAKLLEQGLQVANGIGAQAMRCFMGTDKDRSGPKPLEQLMEATVRNFKSVRARAMDLGVKIAIENHKDLLAREAKQLIEESGTDFTASNIDFGNPLTIMEHPMTTLEILGPYTVTSHLRDTAVYETPQGAAAQWTALGDGSVDLKELIGKFSQVCPQVSVHLEIITGRTPYLLPYFNPAFWKTFHDMPGQDFARFVALAKKGQPFRGNMVIEDVEGQLPAPQFKTALEYQQRSDLERSFKYAKEVLGLGPAA